MSRHFVKKCIAPFFRLFIKYYFTVPRAYRFRDIKAIVLPGVFHPQFTLSTNILLEFLEQHILAGKSFLELGCGTGVISTYAAKRGANVMASDISPKALENTLLNAENNQVHVTTCYSDLFESIDPNEFDIIIINPPYYPKNPKNTEEAAWFCGENFTYFSRLFSTLPPYFNTHSFVWMILSQDCDINRIKTIAATNSMQLSVVQERVKWGERNSIFKIERTKLS